MRNGKVKIIAILSRCRTGSTTLNRAISGDDCAVSYAEVLNGFQPHSYQNYVLDLVARDKDARAAFLSQGPLFAFAAYVSHLIDEAVAKKPGLRIFAFECKIENILAFSSQWTPPAWNFQAIEALTKCIELSDVILFLRRRNFLERFCSNFAAAETGVYHADMGSQQQAAAESRLRFTVEDIPKFVRDLEAEVEFERGMLTHTKQKKPNTVLIDYEEVYKNNQFTPGFLAKFSEITNGMILSQPEFGKVRPVAAREMITNYPDVEAAIRSSLILSPLFAVAEVGFAIGEVGDRYLRSGFSSPESWGVWTDGDRAELILPLGCATGRGLRLTLELACSAALRHAEFPARGRILVNQEPVAEIGGSPAIPDRLMTVILLPPQSEPELTILFEFTGLRPPAEFCDSPDLRRIGFGLISLRIEDREAVAA